MKGMLDRFEGNKAVLLMEELNKEWIVEKSQLPEGSETGDWFTMELTDDELSDIVIDHQLTEEKKQSVDDLMKSIRSKSKGSKFKRK
ncbi:DUF3006 domain-containing protein [Desemzia sp. RIT804]|uniref:DUF3006 domain-containing protein n=1 Tax=Desemzia sp. RIT 804 TaxID=2810209 RepID=UPI00194F74AE|nr:DUF3006 domain-containing protein [Desemzia sp. RIT 804]MBM6615574.1 DUF3006 domain-containing protein [Desemzia sp. RIT 804]